MANRVLKALRTRTASVLRPSPLVSVIIPVFNVGRYLDEAITSVRNQTHERLQIIVIDDGSTDDSRAVAERHAAQDRRIEFHTQSNRGLGATRNVGVRLARGKYLTFVDSDDRLRLDAIERLVRAAERDRADITVAPLIRFNSSKTWQPEWVARLHSESRILSGISDFPELLRNNYSPGRLFLRSFWADNDASFREGVPYEDQPLTTLLYIRAGTIVSIAEPTYEYRERDDGSSISQQTHTLKDLDARIDAWRATIHALKRENPPENVVTAWLQTIYGTHVHWYLNNEGARDREYWNHLRAGIHEVDRAWPHSSAAWTTPPREIALSCLRDDRQAEYLSLRDSGLYDADRQSYRLTDGRLYWAPALPMANGQGACYEVDWERLPETTSAVISAVWEEATGDLLIVGYHFPPKLELSGLTISHELEIHDESTNRKVSIPTQPISAELARFETRGANSSLQGGSFEARIPASTFPDPGNSEAVIRLGITSHFDGLVKSSRLDFAPKWFNVRHCGPLLTPDGLLVSPAVDLESRRFSIRLSRPPGRLTANPGLDDALAVQAVGTSGLIALTALDLPDEATASLSAETEAGQIIENDQLESLLPAGSGERSELGAKDTAGRSLPLAYCGEPGMIVGRHMVDFDESGHATLAAPKWFCRLTDFRFVGNRVTVGVRCLNAEGWALRGLGLRSRRCEFLIDAETLPNGGFVAELPLERDRFGLGPAVLPEGGYDLIAEFAGPDGATRRVRVNADREYIRHVPALHRLGGSRWRTLVADKGFVHIDCHPDVSWGETSRPRQEQRMLQVRRAHPERRLHGALFRSYFGEQFNCNAAAVTAELLRRGFDQPITWVVRDGSVRVPPEVRKVVSRSPEWFEAMDSTKYYFDNMFQPWFFEKRPGQTLIQTFHGYPFKQMGHGLWTQSGLSSAMIASYDRRAAEWDYLVSPASYATPLLRREFRYEGAVLEAGYPRNDILLSSEADGIRQRLRERLGIAEDQIAVLYAPTFRDWLSPDGHRALSSDRGEVEQLATELGSEYCVLHRAHAFVARSAEVAPEAAGVIDVTLYPEPAHLYLAADVAVVDYSSLRFDFAVTGKPMVFFVPDLDRYRSERGWLFDFEPTAPGPLARSIDEAIDWLKSIGRIRSQFEGAYADFRTAYLDREDGHASARVADAVFYGS